MVREETSIAEKKNIKLFPNENIVLNKKFNNRQPDIWFKYHNLVIEVDEENHENYDLDDEKEREDLFKNHHFKIFRCNPNDPNFDLLKFLGEINFCTYQNYAKKMQQTKRIIKQLIKLLKTLKK